ncbi:MAG TPA: translocation/assembly module TamB domain-containing protein, partial [Saprospiraceae bacterium]|nr:translocation/assembly module TamB domain-containing protein [Saprospiraceae bacterium]
MINLEIAKGILHPMDVHALMSNSNWMHDISWSKDQAISLSGHIFGRTTSLKGKKIHFNYANQLHFDGDISARNLFEPEQALINLRVLLLSTNAAFIRKTFPKLHIPAQYDRFGRIQMNGQFDGYFKNFVAFGTFRTELGEIRTDVKFRFGKSIRNAEYSGKVLAEGLNLGNLLQEEDFGKLSFAAEVYNGKGLTQENLAASLKGEIRSFEYKKYRYQNILVSGVFNKDQFQGSVASQDPNASFNLSGIIQREQSHWNVDLQTKVQHLDLLRLNLSQDSITFGGSISGKFSGSTEDDLSGYIRVQDAKLRLRHNDFEMASINLEQDIIRNNRRLRLQSDFVDFGLEGKFRIRELKDVMLQHLEKRHPTLSSTFNLISKKKVSASAFNGYLTVKKGPKLALLLGTPLIVHNADLDIQFDSKNDFLEIKSNRFDAAFQRLSLGKFSFNVTSGDNLFIVSTADYIDSGGKKLGGNFKFTSRIQGHSGQTGIQIFDSTNTRILVNVNSQMSSQEQKLIISLLNKDLFFNNKRWLIAPTNLMSIGKNQLIIRDFELTDSIYYLSIRDVNEKGIAVKTDGFDISFVNAFIKNKSISFSGLFNSDLIIPDLKSLSGVSGSINVFQLHFNKDNYGPFSVRFSADDFTKPWNLKLENAFQEHVLRGEGSINIPSKRAVYSGNAFDFNLNLDARAFPLAFLENFIASISKTHGGCDGKINFFREDGGFYLTGNLKTREGGTHINYLGIPVQFKDQPIQLQKDRIVFDDLTIGDKLGNPISVDGTLYHTQLKNYHSDIRIRSPKALMLDTEKSENSYYYGYGIGSFDVTFKGPFSMLDMDVKATSQKGTKISIPVQSQQSAAESGFVRFNSPAKSNELVGVSSPSPISGLNLNMQLTMTEEAEVAIIFDELAGDILRGNGRGNMVIKSLRNGLFTINGNFEVEQGQYLFTLYNFVNKPFTIRRGGTINWTGDPLDADINLEATYEGLYAAPYPLIQEYPLNDDQNLTEEAKRRTDVELTMKLSGSLLKPDIHFDIEMPDLTGLLKNYSDNKLTFLRSNQDQMNQQVFGLLVLRTFLSSANPFEGGVFGNIQATTINTMSEMLSNQFSLFVSSLLSNAFDDVDFISGVDFNIGYDLDNATIGGTKLNEGEVVFSLRHRLWNEQLIVTLGGNYKSNSSIYGNSYFNPESVIEWNTPVEGLKLRIYYRGDESI